MSDSHEHELPNRAESLMRRLFERVGTAFDTALGRGAHTPQGADATALVPLVERAIRDKARRDGSQMVAPHVIELRYDYETYQQLTPEQRAYLQREIKASAYEFVVNHRMTLSGELQVQLAFDVFTRKLTITAHFGDKADAVAPAAATARGNAPTVRPTAKPASVTVRLHPTEPRFGEMHIQLSAANNRAGIGRSRDNDLCLNDASVSSFHAALTLGSDGQLWLTDLGSSNGTTVNQSRLTEGTKQLVSNGDRMCFGEVGFTLQQATL